MTNITQVHTDRNSEHDSLCLLCGKSLYFLVDVVSWRCYKLIQFTEGYSPYSCSSLDALFSRPYSRSRLC